MDKRKVIFYADELNDEFSKAVIKPIKIDENYRYIKSGKLNRVAYFFWYRIIATPIAFLYTKIVFGQKTVGRKKLKKFLKTGYFIYGNHTQATADAFIPSMLGFPKRNFVIVHPNNVSMPVLGKITPYLGAIPLPDTKKAFADFSYCIKKRIEDGNAVVIYPEAHIWPYYTKIRNFKDTSFAYPIKYSAPVFSFTNTYQKGKLFGKIKIVTYIDGPFYPDKDLNLNGQRKKLRDEVYTAMCRRAENSTVEKIKYIRKGKSDD